MVKKKTSPTPIICSDTGWALMYVLIFCIIIQGIVLLSAGFVIHSIRSGSVFTSLLSGRHAPAGARPTSESTLYGAPEGWDHACFRTEVTERKLENESLFTWRARLGQQPSQAVPDRSFSAWRPFIILLVDDSKCMLASSGYAYDEDRIYFERAAREIAPSRERDDLANILVTAEGTYFRGTYGNLSKQAVNLYSFGGSLQCWTKARSHLAGLVEDMDMCPMAVATTSRGIIQPFTYDRKSLITALESIRPQAEEARLAEACLAMTGQFPEKCGTSNHIIVATAGIALKDGHIPSGIQDFDHDNNPRDGAFDENSHCLDDVAAYAASKGIHVHTVGPESAFLKETASKGNGVFMPSKETFKPPGPFICQIPGLCASTRRYPVNADLAFSPGWLAMENASYLRLMANTPLHLASSGKFTPHGVAQALYPSGQRLFCMTSRDDLLSIDMLSGACSWVVHGAGGVVKAQEGMIVAGPNMDGDILGLSDAPALKWTVKGDLFTLGPGVAFIARGATLFSCSLATGAVEAGLSLGSDIRILEYDPSLDCVMASSGTDLIYVLTRGLKIQALLNPDLPVPLDMIRAFHLRKTLHVVAMARNYAACMTSGKILWKASLEGGACTSALILDSKLYLTTWSPGECGGIDSGSTSLQVFDVKSGDRISSVPMFGSLSLGPVIDMDSGAMEYFSPNMDRYQVDISDLAGMKPCPLGTRLK
jgi:hypothetical protein